MFLLFCSRKDSDLCSQTDLNVNSSSDTYELCDLESNVLIWKQIILLCLTGVV